MAGLVTESTKRNRVYQRAFDHEEAQRLREAGWSIPRIADHMGVSVTAVYRVCDPAVRERMQEKADKKLRDMREPCLGGCGRLVWMHNAKATGYCPACAGIQRSAAHVRDTELQCTRCNEWKPDAEFSDAQGRRSRRGKQSWCRKCNSATRQARRLATPELERAAQNKNKRKGLPMSKFIVLSKNGDGGWHEYARVEAATRMHAVEKTATDEGVYVAVTEGQMTEMPVRKTMVLKVAPRDEVA